MAEPLRRWFEAVLLLLLAVGFAAAALAARLALPLVLVVALALVLRAFMLWRDLQPRLSPRGEWSAFGLLLPLFAADLLWLHSGAVAAGLHLVLCAGLIKLFTASRARDYWYLRALALLEILAAALLGAGGALLPLLALFTFLMIAGLVLYEVHASRQAARAAAGAQRRLPGRLLRFSFLLSIAVMLLAVGIFLLLPRTAMGGIAPGGAGAALTGFSDDVDLGAVAQLQQSDTPVMHIRITSGGVTPIQLQHVLWRGRALARFDGRRWTALDRPWPELTQSGMLDVRYRLYPGTRPQVLRYQVTLAPLATPVLFFPAHLVHTLTRYETLGYDADTETVSGARFGGGAETFGATSYTGLSDIGQPPPHILRLAPALVPDDMRIYLRQPENLNPRIPVLAYRVAGSQPDNYDRIRALQQYLVGGGFSYSLDNLPQGADPLSAFLFQARSGDCEYFATALAVMGRALGVPTRLVNGFELGPYNPITGEYIVDAQQAHSWVEAWFPLPDGVAPPPRDDPEARGVWVAFDATPPASIAGGAETSRAAFLLDALSSTFQEWVVSYDWIHQAMLARRLQDGMESRVAAVWNSAQRYGEALHSFVAATRRVPRGRAPWWLFAGLGLLAGIVVLLRFSRRAGALFDPARRNPTGWRERQARRLYRRFQARLRRAGIRRAPAETAEELLARVPPGAGREPAARFVRGYLALRFDGGGDPRALAAVLKEVRY